MMNSFICSKPIDYTPISIEGGGNLQEYSLSDTLVTTHVLRYGSCPFCFLNMSLLEILIPDPTKNLWEKSFNKKRSPAASKNSCRALLYYLDNCNFNCIIEFLIGNSFSSYINDQKLMNHRLLICEVILIIASVLRTGCISDRSCIRQAVPCF